MYNRIAGYKQYYKSLVMLGVPIIIGQLGAIITGLADTIMVGQHSTEELAAASFVNNVINAFIIMGTGFSYNLTPLIGQNLAMNKKIVIGGWLKNILFVMLYNSFRQFVEGIANPSISMWVLLTGNLLNIIGNYILIYGKCGMPELGLLGAGISTFISRIIMLLLFIAVFMLRTDYKPYRKGFTHIRINKQSWRRLNSIGWPISLQQGLEAGTFCVTAIMVGWLGSLELAAHQIAITISTISFTIYLGLGAAVAIRTSYYKGANDWYMVRKITIAGLHLGLIVVCIVCTTLFMTQSWLGLIFTDNLHVNAIVKTLLPILMLYQIGDSAQIILANSLRGLADVKAIMWISFLAYFIIAIPAGYLLGFTFHWGIAGIWMAYPLGFLCSVCLLGYRAKMQVKSHLA